VALSAWREPLSFQVPPSASRRPWRRVVDTALAAPLDIVAAEEGPVVPAGSAYGLAPYSLLLLISEG
jgi:glycogen operon protein